VITYTLRHLQVLFFSLGQLWRSGLSSLMTVAVIGITLALPSGLYVLLDNARHVAAGWESGAQISLFLTPQTSAQAAQTLAEQLRHTPGVADVDYVSPQAALTEFKRYSGFGDALNALDSNPLPAVLIVHPAASHSTPAALEDLVAKLGAVQAVDIAQLDLEWIKRLHAMLLLAQRGVVLLAGLLAVAVLVIIGNTVRLAILNRRDEIEVIKLIGGTDAFIRRPFLYSGLLQGLLGAAGAWLLVSLGLFAVGGPAHRLAALYASNFQIQGLPLSASIALLATGGTLGWLASWIAVGRHLRDIEPH
jgi:cell division transport system permease protein